MLAICDRLGDLLKSGQLERWKKLDLYKTMYEEARSQFDSEKHRLQVSVRMRLTTPRTKDTLDNRKLYSARGN